MEELRTFDDGELLAGYLDEAAWFWFDASTETKKLETGLHRLMARCIYDEIRRRGLREADAEEVYARARRAFPPDDLRARHRRDFRFRFGTSSNPGW